MLVVMVGEMLVVRAMLVVRDPLVRWTLVFRPLTSVAAPKIVGGWCNIGGGGQRNIGGGGQSDIGGGGQSNIGGGGESNIGGGGESNISGGDESNISGGGERDVGGWSNIGYWRSIGQIDVGVQTIDVSGRSNVGG